METDDKELKLYHDVLTELIEQHFYNSYLTQVSEELEKKYPPILDFSDTAEFKRDLIRAQNKLFNDTAKFGTICYRPALEMGPWTDYHKPSDFRSILKTLSSSWEAVADTIALSQTKYTGDNFRLCTSKVVPGSRFYECDIGVVAFSKVFLNENKTKGVLYYEYMCGGKCGMGEIILVELVEEHWKIKEVHQLWIS